MGSLMPIFVTLGFGGLQAGSVGEGCLLLLTWGFWVYDLLPDRAFSLPQEAEGAELKDKSRRENRSHLTLHLKSPKASQSPQDSAQLLNKFTQPFGIFPSVVTAPVSSSS